MFFLKKIVFKKVLMSFCIISYWFKFIFFLTFAFDDNDILCWVVFLYKFVFNNDMVKLACK